MAKKKINTTAGETQNGDSFSLGSAEIYVEQSKRVVRSNWGSEWGVEQGHSGRTLLGS
jgi:hypothetical protein